MEMALFLQLYLTFRSSIAEKDTIFKNQCLYLTAWNFLMLKNAELIQQNSRHCLVYERL